ncbi:MAG: YdiY family protein [Phycisphaerales bacterium JB063]
MIKLFTTTALMLAATGLASAETIELVDGDVINAPITARDAGTVTVNHPSLGEMTISRDRIVAIHEDADAHAEAEAEEAAAEAADALAAERAADEGMFGTGLFKGWNRQISLGVNGAEGNSRNVNIRANFHTDYEDDTDRWIFDMLYRVSRSSGATTENRFQAELTKDWLLPEEDYFFWANGKFEWDDFEAWDNRISGFLGAGYQFVDNDTWNVRGRAGIGGNQTNGGNTNEFTFEALLGVEVDYVISDKQSVAFTNYLYPSLEDSEFRNITTLAWQVQIDQDKGMSLQLGVANEYDSNAPTGTKKNDFTYYAALVWDF